MSTDLDISFCEHLMNINTKLKKRFMRKPNILEATNEFNALAIQCENCEQPTFAGHAYIGAAKCENLAGNSFGEAEYYLAAARQFVKAEMKLKSLKCHSPDRENLEAAIGSYLQALNKYPKKSPLRTSVLMELANNLVILNHKFEAIAYYEQALHSIEEMDSQKLKCLTSLLSLNIHCGRHKIALDTANSICDSNINIPNNVMIEVGISRILLTLLIEPKEDEKPPSLQKLFQDVMSDSEDEAHMFGVDLKLKMQSIIISVRMKDVESLVEVSADTPRIFTLQHQDLLIHLIRQMEQRV